MSGLAPKVPNIDRITDFRHNSHRSPGWADIRRKDHHRYLRNLAVEVEMPEKTRAQLDSEYELWVLASLERQGRLFP